jgi:biotin operon repressor
MLLTQLDGFKIQDSTRGREAKDPLNYKIIDLKTISDNLCLDEKHIKKSIKKLRHDGYLEKGSNDTITKGYRFTF